MGQSVQQAIMNWSRPQDAKHPSKALRRKSRSAAHHAQRAAGPVIRSRCQNRVLAYCCTVSHGRQRSFVPDMGGCRRSSCLQSVKRSLFVAVKNYFTISRDGQILRRHAGKATNVSRISPRRLGTSTYVGIRRQPRPQRSFDCADDRKFELTIDGILNS